MNVQKFALWLACVALTACDAEVHSLKGSPDTFCIPEHYQASMPFWMPLSSDEQLDGFMVRGCWGRSSQEACPLPPSVLSVVVSPLSSARPTAWEDLPAAGFEKKVADAADTEIQVFDGGRMAAFSNRRLWNAQHIWKRTHGTFQEVGAKLGGGDRLLGTCEVKHAATPVKGGEFPFCRVGMVFPNYVIEFTFQSDSMTPADSEEIGRKIAVTLDDWKCGPSPQ